MGAAERQEEVSFGNSTGKSPRAVRAVSFDVGGTLIEPWPSVGHVYSEVAARHGWKGISPELLTRRFRRAWRAFKDFGHTRSQWAALVDATFQGLTAPPPSETFFPELYDRFTHPDAWHVFEDVVPALEGLAARGLKLAIISNWDERLRPLLQQLDLQRYFRHIVISCEVGASKPSPIIFQHAARVLRLPPQVILHVGDSPEMDLVGALAAGFQAVLLQRQAKRARKGSITRLAELQDWNGSNAEKVEIVDYH